MLAELCDLLVCFEFVTNELQTNDISVSRIYPCYLFLKARLEAKTYTIIVNNIETTFTYVHAIQIKKDLVASLEKRFAKLIEDKDDTQIKEYFLLIETNKYKDALLFWRLHYKSLSFVNLAKLAQKYLGVPATSAAVERMFSISGHILNNKRRTTGILLVIS